MSKAASKVILHPYTPAMIVLLERWLAKMAAKGWRLINVKGFRFTFQRYQPYPAEFFGYFPFDTSKGVSATYWMSKTRYARKGAPLNKASLPIYEVDPQKRDADFSSYVYLRDKYYLKHYLLLGLFSLFWIVLLTVLYKSLTAISCIWIFFLLYSCVSIGILLLEMKQKQHL